MKNGVAIYGGSEGTETALSQRVLSTPLATILSGDIGTTGNAGDNSYHVISNLPGLTTSAVLDGFVITGCNANGSDEVLVMEMCGGTAMAELGPSPGQFVKSLLYSCWLCWPSVRKTLSTASSTLW
ncbi:hypothetical protein GCM10027592_43120 [Spirosoma flavus]